KTAVASREVSRSVLVLLKPLGSQRRRAELPAEPPTQSRGRRCPRRCVSSHGGAPIDCSSPSQDSLPSKTNPRPSAVPFLKGWLSIWTLLGSSRPAWRNPAPVRSRWMAWHRGSLKPPEPPAPGRGKSRWARLRRFYPPVMSWRVSLFHQRMAGRSYRKAERALLTWRRRFTTHAPIAQPSLGQAPCSRKVVFPAAKSILPGGG